MYTVTKRGEVISRVQRSLISLRYRKITKAINTEFWGSTSETEHSFYVGSYGRGTAIDTSDIDILVELPKDVFQRFDAHKGNGQSRLLQAVKAAIESTYSRSMVRADGQVIVVTFSDGIKFEILPAFRHIVFGYWDGTYEYPDSNMGGRWLTTNPKAEQDAMKSRNEYSNGLLYDTCKHMRYIRDNYFSGYHLPGIVIDSFAYHYIKDWHWLSEGESPSDKPTGTYEKGLYQTCPSCSFNLNAPGSEMKVDTSRCIDVLNKVLNFMSKD
ncbi:MAG: nucleotidyltransferase domain-containing protein [Bacteroidales bacterium]|nr:nucleotidyltransferase domain-containing protein [Bacteroidales bacterium]